MMTDKDRIRVAKVGEDYITRGDLSKAIRDMPAEERPTIRTKGDLRAALEDIIDERLRQGQAAALKEQGKINVTPEEAEIQYFARYPQKYVEYKQMEAVLPETDLQHYKEEHELAIDREQERLLGGRALAYLINDAVRNGTLAVTDDQYEEQYEIRKAQLMTFEKVVFEGVYLPLDAHKDVSAEAKKVQQQLVDGADPKAIAEAYGEGKAGYLEASLTTEATDIKFLSFWQQAAGCKEGDIVSAYIGDWQHNVVVGGEVKKELIPDSLLVCRITQHIPQRQKTLEEAKPDLRTSILFSQMMERLRKNAGVQIYDKKLPDPGMYDTARPSSIFQQ